MNYDLWHATKPSGDFEIMAISVELSGENPADYFGYGFSKPEHYGLIAIDGDADLCAEYFSVK